MWSVLVSGKARENSGFEKTDELGRVARGLGSWIIYDECQGWVSDATRGVPRGHPNRKHGVKPREPASPPPPPDAPLHEGAAPSATACRRCHERTTIEMGERKKGRATLFRGIHCPLERKGWVISVIGARWCVSIFSWKWSIWRELEELWN